MRWACLKVVCQAAAIGAVTSDREDLQGEAVPIKRPDWPLKASVMEHSLEYVQLKWGRAKREREREIDIYVYIHM